MSQHKQNFHQTGCISKLYQEHLSSSQPPAMKWNTSIPLLSITLLEWHDFKSRLYNIQSLYDYSYDFLLIPIQAHHKYQNFCVVLYYLKSTKLEEKYLHQIVNIFLKCINYKHNIDFRCHNNRMITWIMTKAWQYI